MFRVVCSLDIVKIERQYTVILQVKTITDCICTGLLETDLSGFLFAKSFKIISKSMVSAGF